MKKIFAVVTLCTFCILSIFSETSNFNFKHPEVISPRYSGMGGYHSADKVSYLSILSNPANISLVGDCFYFPSISANVNGNIAQLPTLIEGLKSGEAEGEEKQKFSEKMIKLLSENSSLDLGTTISGPITVGGIKKNFGWGVFNRTYALANIPSMNASNIYGGEEVEFCFGYSFPLRLPYGTIISIGIMTKTFMQVEACYNDSPVDLLSSNITKLPLYSDIGFGFDLGVTVELLKAIRISVCVEDFFARALLKQFEDLKSIFTLKSLFEKRIIKIDPKIKLGLALDIPTYKLTKGFITSWSIFADYNNFLELRKNITSKNGLLNFSIGTEFYIFNTLAFRFGYNQTYYSAGFGIKMEKVHVDFAIYGEEKGLEPGSIPRLNMSFGITIQK